MIALLERSSVDLLKLHFEDILNYFKELPLTIDACSIMDAALKVPLKKRHIEKYAKEWASQK